MKCYVFENICGVLFNFRLIVDMFYVKIIDIRLKKIGFIYFKYFRIFIWVFLILVNVFSFNIFNKIKVIDYENIYFRIISKFDIIVERCLGVRGFELGGGEGGRDGGGAR